MHIKDFLQLSIMQPTIKSHISHGGINVPPAVVHEAARD